MSNPRVEPKSEGCPICHRPVGSDEASEWVPVCPLVYPKVEGLRCHQDCLAEERQRNRFLRRDDLRPGLLRRRSRSDDDEGGE